MSDRVFGATNGLYLAAPHKTRRVAVRLEVVEDSLYVWPEGPTRSIMPLIRAFVVRVVTDDHDLMVVETTNSVYVCTAG